MSDALFAILLTAGLMAATALVAAILLLVNRHEERREKAGPRRCPCGKEEACAYAYCLAMCKDDSRIFFIRNGKPSPRPSLLWWLGFACNLLALASLLLNWNPIPNVRFNLLPVAFWACFLAGMLRSRFKKART